jgi:hypothetical protein
MRGQWSRREQTSSTPPLVTVEVQGEEQMKSKEVARARPNNLDAGLLIEIAKGARELTTATRLVRVCLDERGLMIEVSAWLRDEFGTRRAVVECLVAWPELEQGPRSIVILAMHDALAELAREDGKPLLRADPTGRLPS